MQWKQQQRDMVYTVCDSYSPTWTTTVLTQYHLLNVGLWHMTSISIAANRGCCPAGIPSKWHQHIYVRYRCYIPFVATKCCTRVIATIVLTLHCMMSGVVLWCIDRRCSQTSGHFVKPIIFLPSVGHFVAGFYWLQHQMTGYCLTLWLLIAAHWSSSYSTFAFDQLGTKLSNFTAR